MEEPVEKLHWTDRLVTIPIVVLMILVFGIVAIRSGIVWLLNRGLARFDYEIIEPDFKGRHGYQIVRPKLDLERKLRQDAEDSAQVARFREWLKKV
jgi:hypothetical protein